MLSLLPGTKIRVIEAGGKTALKPVEDIGPSAMVYNSYGQSFPIYIEKAAEEETRVYTMAEGHGEALVFGDKHNMLVRMISTPFWARIPILAVTPEHFVRLPQKKIDCPPGLFDALGFDDTGLHLEASSIKELIGLMESAASCGITVSRRKTEKKADISARKPVCFANKLINGNFATELEETLATFAGSGIIMPWKMWNDDFVKETRRTGIVFEGNCVFNDIGLMPVKTTGSKTPVYHVTFREEDGIVPVELAWITT